MGNKPTNIVSTQSKWWCGSSALSLFCSTPKPPFFHLLNQRKPICTVLLLLKGHRTRENLQFKVVLRKVSVMIFLFGPLLESCVRVSNFIAPDFPHPKTCHATSEQRSHQPKCTIDRFIARPFSAFPLRPANYYKGRFCILQNVMVVWPIINRRPICDIL